MYTKHKHNGSFIFTAENGEKTVMDSVAILVNQKTGMVVSHGPSARMEDEFNIRTQALYATGNVEAAQALILVSGTFSSKELNKLIKLSHSTVKSFIGEIQTNGRLLSTASKEIYAQADQLCA